MGIVIRGRFQKDSAISVRGDKTVSPAGLMSAECPDDVMADGWRFGDHGRHKEAIRCFDRAMDLYRADADIDTQWLALAYHSRGDAYADLGEHHRAIQDYDAAIRLSPGEQRYDSYFNRSRAYDSLGQGDLAAKDLEEGIRLKQLYELDLEKEDIDLRLDA